MQTPTETYPHKPLFSEPDGLRLAAEITKLSAYIYAATYRLLLLIREYDGSITIHARLAPEQATLIIKALEMAMETHQPVGAGPHPRNPNPEKITAVTEQPESFTAKHPAASHAIAP
jgi:hypothetical protein